MTDKKKAPDCMFAVVASNGEKPCAQVNAAAFERENGIAMNAHIEGNGRHIVMMVCDLVKHEGKTLREKDGIIAAAAFVNEIGRALIEGAGDDAIAMASRMMDMLNPEKMAEMIGEMLKKELEEDEE